MRQAPQELPTKSLKSCGSQNQAAGSLASNRRKRDNLPQPIPSVCGRPRISNALNQRSIRSNERLTRARGVLPRDEGIRANSRSSQIINMLRPDFATNRHKSRPPYKPGYAEPAVSVTGLCEDERDCHNFARTTIWARINDGWRRNCTPPRLAVTHLHDRHETGADEPVNRFCRSSVLNAQSQYLSETSKSARFSEKTLKNSDGNANPRFIEILWASPHE